MTKILGIDTSNYTTSIAVVEDDKCILDTRKILNVKQGERGLRQSEALFQHIINLPDLLQSQDVTNIDAICVSTKPRPVEGSYMPVFKAGESVAASIAYVNAGAMPMPMPVKLFKTTHQEGHIEAAFRSAEFSCEMQDFICFHLSGGTTEILKVHRNVEYDIQIIGKTRDISAGQLIDRIGVVLGFDFPCGRMMDTLAMDCDFTDLRIPSKVDGLDMNFSGQETQCLKYIKDGYNQKEIAYSLMLCVSKTLEKTINNVIKRYNLPILLSGGVASSRFITRHLKEQFGRRVAFSKPELSSDNAVGVAYIGYKYLMRG